MTNKWVQDSGLVFLFVCLALGYWQDERFLLGAMAFALLLLFHPPALRPLAYLWLKVAQVLGFVMNRVFFGLVFFIIITPIGYMRRILKGDERDLYPRKNRSSAFVERAGVVVPRDVEMPY